MKEMLLAFCWAASASAAAAQRDEERIGGGEGIHIILYSKLLGWADGCSVGRCSTEKLFQKKGAYVHTQYNHIVTFRMT